MCCRGNAHDYDHLRSSLEFTTPHLHTSMQATTIIGALLACGLASGLDAQRRAPTAEELIDRKEAKLSEPWRKNATWSLSLADAKARAKKEGRLIFAYFTRSYSP